MLHGPQLILWIACTALGCFFGGLGLLAIWRENRAFKRRDRDMQRRLDLYRGLHRRR